MIDDDLRDQLPPSLTTRIDALERAIDAGKRKAFLAGIIAGMVITNLAIFLPRIFV